MNFDALETNSYVEQVALERRVSKIIGRQSEIEGEVSLNRELHIRYLQQGLKSLPQAFSSLEASRPWILYWITHSLALLEACLPPEVSQQGATLWTRTPQEHASLLIVMSKSTPVTVFQALK